MNHLRACSQALLKAAQAGAVSDSVSPESAFRTFQGVVYGTGTVSATIVIEGSNNGSDFLQIGTFDISGTERATNGISSSEKWAYVRARVAAMTGDAVDVHIGF